MKQGFTLLELSIVLVIIGLIIGGITVGADLIRAAELNSVASEFNKYKVALNTFKLKYNGYPGDLDNAEAYWGTANAGDAACRTTTSTGKETCNGDGNGVLGINSTRSNEVYRFWQHLANAEIISGQFTGRHGSGSNNNSNIGLNVPASSFPASGWSAGYNANYAGNSVLYEMDYQNFLVFGGETDTGSTSSPILTPQEALLVDQKLDDGLPAKGLIIAMYWNNLCAVADDGSHANDDYEASYKVSDNTAQCALYFRKIW